MRAEHETDTLIVGAGICGMASAILAAQRGLGWKQTYFVRAKELLDRLEDFVPPKFSRPKILTLHASERGRSATLWLWDRLRPLLEPYCDIREESLQNGTIHDCRGCSYSACLHYAKNGSERLLRAV